MSYYLLLILYYALYSTILDTIVLIFRILSIVTIVIDGFGIVYSNRLQENLIHSNNYATCKRLSGFVKVEDLVSDLGTME